MKNEDLYVYKKSEFYEDFISSQKEYYERENADAYFAERLAEKDAEIAELKQKLQDQCISCPVKMQYDDVVAELKKELEDAKATAYAESVDAGMENRRLKRALYKACDNWAVCEMDYLRKCLEHYEDYFNVRTGEDLTEEKCERMIDNWRKVAHNCRAKAEEYK